MTNLTNMTYSLGRQIADALDEATSLETKTILLGAVHYGTHQTVNDNVVVAYFDGVEIRYRVHKRSKTKRGIRTGDHESGYAIVREDGKVVGVHDLRGLPKSRAAAASEIAWDARNEVIRTHETRSQIAKNIRAFFDRKKTN
jgi:hypothetical protein